METSTTSEVEEFVDGAASIVGPSGERSTAEITTPDGEIRLEFAPFEDCGYLRRGDEVAVDPAYLGEDDQIREDVVRPEPRPIHNLLDEVEVLSSDQLLCTPQWVRSVVSMYVSMGEFPKDITWASAAAGTGENP